MSSVAYQFQGLTNIYFYVSYVLQGLRRFYSFNVGTVVKIGTGLVGFFAHLWKFIVQLGFLIAKYQLIVFSAINSLLSKIISFSPSTSFLSDIATIEGVIIGIAVPLSYEIIARLSDRYHSDVITRKFRERFEIKFLPWVLAVNITIIVIIKFVEGTNFHSTIWIPVAWFLLVGFIIIAIWILRFFHILVMHADPDYLINELSRDANNVF